MGLLCNGAPNGSVMTSPRRAVVGADNELRTASGIEGLAASSSNAAIRLEGASLPADMTSVLLRLGSQIAGCPVYIAPDRIDDDQDGNEATAFSAPAAFCEERIIYGNSMERFGRLRAVDIHDRPELVGPRRGLLDDLASFIGNYLKTRSMLRRTDPVTGLPNRIRFLEEFAEVVDTPGRSAPPPTLVVVGLADPGHYGSVVRALGHDYAEEIIAVGSGIVLDLVPYGIKVFHVSPLSLAFFVSVDGELPQITENLARAFRGPISCKGIPIDNEVGIGAVRLINNQVNGSEALRAAMAAAQDSRYTRAGWAVYDPDADQAHQRAFSLIGDLRRAIESEDQLSLHFQPRIGFTTGRCVSAEALIRWNHPTIGAISPGEFIPLAEATALITPLTDWVLDRSARHAASLAELGYDFPVSVNVSPKNLAEPDFVEKLVDALTRYQLDPSRLELEFTEGMLASDQRAVREQLEIICSMGIEVAIDDFGSGYSNMSYLTQIPARILKIDQAFVQPMLESDKSQRLVKAIIDMGHGLGYRVVAEGIETAAAFAMLAGWDCDEAQGYYISRPLPADEFSKWLDVNADGFKLLENS